MRRAAGEKRIRQRGIGRTREEGRVGRSAGKGWVRVRAEHVLRERPVYAARKLHRANLPLWATRGTVIIAMGSAGICARNIPHAALGELLKISLTEFLNSLVLCAHNAIYGGRISQLFQRIKLLLSISNSLRNNTN